jgi:hypothetical protein
VNPLLLTHQGRTANFGTFAITPSGGRGFIADALVDTINPTAGLVNLTI